jgi:hypothetical protein
MKSRREMFELVTLPNALDEANRRVFERDCAAAGIDPGRGVSPSLLRQLGERDVAASEEAA